MKESEEEEEEEEEERGGESKAPPPGRVDCTTVYTLLGDGWRERESARNSGRSTHSNIVCVASTQTHTRVCGWVGGKAECGEDYLLPQYHY